MMPDRFEIEKYNDSHRLQVLDVWEKSVLATHHFLLPDDFIEIKALVASMDFHQLDVYCLVNPENVVGFVGVANRKIEMLFLHPDEFGRGLGRRLLDFAVAELAADKLDVNEQNTNALLLYLKCGFEPYDRSELDEQGHHYPILRMKLGQHPRKLPWEDDRQQT